MAVKVHCSICDKFIKDVSNHEFQRLTGEEICEGCGKKVKSVYGKLDKLVSDSEKEIEESRKKMLKITGAFNEIIKKYTDHVKSFHTTRTAEIDSKMRDILGG